MAGQQSRDSFPARRAEDWQALVRAATGADAEIALRDGAAYRVAVAALQQQRHAGRLACARAGGEPWCVVERVDHPDPAASNALIRSAVEGGAGGIALVLPGSPCANGRGIALVGQEDMDRLLAGLDVAGTRWRIEAGHEARYVAAMFAVLCERRGIDPAGIELDLCLNPAAAAALLPFMPAGSDVIAARVCDAVQALADRGFGGMRLVADGRPWHAAGACQAQELGLAVANAVAHLRMLDAAGFDLSGFAGSIGFALACDTDQFATMAKIRAARLLWREVLSASGLEPVAVHIHAVTAWRMMTRRDPWANILRGAVAVAGAALGGADSISVLPYTDAIGLARAPARRIARNTQLVLLEEARLADVADPASGSGYIETMTEEIARRAWQVFQSVEAEGGIAAALSVGRVQASVAETMQARRRAVAAGREPLVGVSEFANLSELPVAVEEASAEFVLGAGEPPRLPQPGRGALFEAIARSLATGAGIAELAVGYGGGERARPLPRERLAEPFERLRDAADAVERARGRRPFVFVAGFGLLAGVAARLTWLRNALAAGGLDVLEGPVGEDADAVAAAFADSGASMALVAVDDARLADAGPVLVSALRARGAARVDVAGRPGDVEQALREAGADAFVYAGCDMVAWLEGVHRHLGLPERTRGHRQ